MIVSLYPNSSKTYNNICVPPHKFIFVSFFPNHMYLQKMKIMFLEDR